MKNTRDVIKSVLTAQYYAVLCSADNGQAFGNLVAFAAAENLKSIAFATARRTSKYSRVKNNRQVSLLIDNRTNRDSDVLSAIAITAYGLAAELTRGAAAYKKLLARKHPHLSEFVGRPDTAIFRIKISAYAVAGFDRSELVLTQHFA